MDNKLLSITDGTYTLSESNVKNQFYFYRNDGNELGKIQHEPMELYQVYIMHKMTLGEMTDIIMSNVEFEESTDGKCIRMTMSEIHGTSESKMNEQPKKLNFFQRLKKKIFG